jgi:hypothetical protein
MLWLLLLQAFVAVPIARAQDSGLTITLDKFGVGNEARCGDTAGIRLVLVDSAASNRTVLIRLSRLDPDGDTIESERVITTNPGIKQGVWFYTRVPYDVYERRAGSGLVATAFEAIEEQSPAPGQPAFTPGRVLARSLIEPKAGSLQPRTIGLLAVTGTAHLGLRDYSPDRAGSPVPWAAGRGEATRVVQGIEVEDMPDQWHGWAAYETLVWTKGEPSELKGERARAIREWVQRGGHLVIVLPAVGQTWTNRQSNELFAILPTVSIRRREGVDMEPYRPMLVGRKEVLEEIEEGKVLRRDIVLPRSAVVHTFAPTPEAASWDAISVLNGPDGECVVTRRLVGLGCVTLVGLDLLRGSTDIQAFGHRVLGKRGKIPTAVEARTAGAQNTLGSASILDVGISRELNERQQGKSATGLLLGFVLFIVYWLIAGPLGFAILRHRKQTAHAWVGFFISGVAFTAIAWAGATSLRPKKIEVSHVTLFDHVYGQPSQRSRTWASILLPEYGDSILRVGEPDAASAATATWDFIAPWETSDDDARRASFPDARAYRVDARTPDSMRVPTRATVKEIIADWSGGTIWRMPVPDVAADGSESKIEWSQPIPGEPPILKGILRHELPGPLKDLKILLIREQDDFPPSGSAPTESWFSKGRILYYSEWKPGEPLDLELLQQGLKPGDAALRGFLDQLVPPPASGAMSMGWTPTPAEPVQPQPRLVAAMFTPMLPWVATDQASFISPSVGLRSATHGWDLARWFTHPCVIIIGELEGPTPTPFFVDGERVASQGKTYVRWVYPLPSKPPGFRDNDLKKALPEAAQPDAPPGPSPPL